MKWDSVNFNVPWATVANCATVSIKSICTFIKRNLLQILMSVLGTTRVMIMQSVMTLTAATGVTVTLDSTEMDITAQVCYRAEVERVF